MQQTRVQDRATSKQHCASAGRNIAQAGEEFCTLLRARLRLSCLIMLTTTRSRNSHNVNTLAPSKSPSRPPTSPEITTVITTDL